MGVRDVVDTLKRSYLVDWISTKKEREVAFEAVMVVN